MPRRRVPGHHGRLVHDLRPVVRLGFGVLTEGQLVGFDLRDRRGGRLRGRAGERGTGCEGADEVVAAVGSSSPIANTGAVLPSCLPATLCPSPEAAATRSVLWTLTDVSHTGVCVST